MKKITLSLVACLATLIMFAQAPGRKSVVLDYFGKTAKVSSTARDIIRAGVLTALTNSGRLNLIDATNTTAIQLSESVAEQDVIPTVDNIRQNAMKESGGNLLVSGTITNIDATREKTSDGKIYYSGVVSFSLNIVDLETGNNISARNIDYSGLNAKTGKTREEAITNTMDYIPLSMTKFINDNFKLETKIIEIAEQKKGKASLVYINAGSSVGITKTQTFKMFVESEVAGVKRTKDIGRLTVESIEGDELTLCKVQKTEEDLIGLFNSGTEIIVVTDREKTGATIGKGLGGFLK